MAYLPYNQHFNNKLTITSYNILAQCYESHNRRSANPSQLAYLDNHSQRLNDIVARILSTNSDVVCLQEVDSRDELTLTPQLQRLGYQCYYNKRLGASPTDGCMTCIKPDKFQQITPTMSIPYNDTTNRMAQVTRVITKQGKEIDIWNTHLQGGPDYKVVKKQQAATLIHQIQSRAKPSIVCGDYNSTPQDESIQLITSQGLSYVPTNATTKLGTTPLAIDFIFYSKDLPRPTMQPLASVDTLLSKHEPSDHLPLQATFDLSAAIGPLSTAYTPPLAQTSVNYTPIASPSYAPMLSTSTYQTAPSLSQSIPSYVPTPAYVAQTAPSFSQSIPGYVPTPAYVTQTAPRATPLELISADYPRMSSEQVFAHVNQQLYPEVPAAFRNNQPFNGSPSYRHKIFTSFNSRFALRLGQNQNTLYNTVAQYFEAILTQADTESRQGKGAFKDLLLVKIRALPSCALRYLYEEAVMWTN